METKQSSMGHQFSTAPSNCPGLAPGTGSVTDQITTAHVWGQPDFRVREQGGEDHQKGKPRLFLG